MAVEEMNSQSNDGKGFDLPENCIAIALSFTTPMDAWGLSLVGSTFNSAAQSDVVWEGWLPPDYRDILGRSAEGIELLRSAISKKQLYRRLCDNPILIDSGTKSFSLEKSSGKKCYMLGARDITIVWSSTPEYWRWIPHSESRFTEVAELLNVCWLEIRGKINCCMLSPDTNYAAYLVFKWESLRGLDQPAEAGIRLSGHEAKKLAVHFNPEGAQRHRPQVRRPIWREGLLDHPQRYAKQRGDGWMEVELGEIFINRRQDVDLRMSLLEVGEWKSGLIVEGIEVRPKEGNKM